MQIGKAVLVKARWGHRKATDFQCVYHKKGLMFVAFHTVIESDLVPEKCALDPKSGLCGAQIWEESRPVETFWCQTVTVS